MKLYLVRHAVAYAHGDPNFPNDDDRPLTPKGRKQFERAVEGLLELIDPPAAILTSPLPRAAQTAAILCTAAGRGESEIVICEALRPGGQFEQVLKDCTARLYAGAGDAEVDQQQRNPVSERGLALVGHRPGIGLLAAWLLGGEEAGYALPFEKGGAACLSFEGPPAAGAGELDWLLTPKIMRRLR
ncbi:MAG TPA: histidine phosphatase family protein [Dehalococcoidia bacterium]|nr:histidine phosphatase family protein [Dehalococcoidia bacterium]